MVSNHLLLFMLRLSDIYDTMCTMWWIKVACVFLFGGSKINLKVNKKVSIGLCGSCLPHVVL